MNELVSKTEVDPHRDDEPRRSIEPVSRLTRHAWLGWFVVSTLILTWPLAAHLNDALPLGSERSGTIPYFNLWTFAWNADRLADGYDGYWNAPIFHPTSGTFALSDPQPFTGFLFAAVRNVVGGDVATYNLLFLATVLANGIAAAWLARTLGCCVTAAALAGLLAQSLPALAAESGVFQLAGIAPSLVAIGLSIRLARQPRTSTGLALGSMLVITFLTSAYYGVYTGLLLLPGLAFLLHRIPRRREWRAGLAAALPILVLLVPWTMQQSSNSIDHDRSADALVRTSARTFDYAGLPLVTLAGGRAPWLSTRDDLRVGLYPGTALMALAVVGFLASRRSRRGRRLAAFFAFGAGLAFVLSLGPRIDGGVAGPYRLLHELVPGFDKMRNTYRFGVFVQVFLLMLAMLGLREAFRRKHATLAVVCVALGLLEILPIPRRLVTAPPDRASSSWAQGLSQLPDGVAVALPFPQSKRASAYARTVVDMLYALDHGKPLLNGYSGFLPKVHREDYPAFETFPHGDWLAWCERRDVRYVIFDVAWLRENHPNFVPPQALAFVTGDATRSVYERVPPPEDAQREAGSR